MRDLRKTTRPLVRLLSTLVTVAMMWLPATALADDGGFEPTTTVLPLLGSNLTIEIATDGAGVVTSVSVDGQVVDFEQEDDEISFLFSVEGQTFKITVEFEDDDDDEGDDDHDEGEFEDEADDDEGDDEGDLDDETDDDEGDEGDDEGDLDDETDDDETDDDEGDDEGDLDDETDDDDDDTDETDDDDDDSEGDS